MKKFLAVIVIILLTFAVSSCAFVVYEDDLDVVSKNPDNEVAIYTALNVNVLAYRVVGSNEDVSTQYVIEIGVKEELYDYANVENALSAFMREQGVSCNRLSYYTTNSEGQTYKYYYASVVSSEDCLTYDEKENYGFFYVSQYYTLTAPKWIDNIRQGLFTRIQESFDDAYWGSGQRYVIDVDATRIRYFFYEEVELSSDGAKMVNKKFMTQAQQYFKCLMWESTGEYSYQNITLEYRAPASGFYLEAIVMGLAVVFIMLAVFRAKDAKDKKKKVVVEASEPQPSEVLDGQISMVDLGLDLSSSQQSVDEAEQGETQVETEENDG